MPSFISASNFDGLLLDNFSGISRIFETMAVEKQRLEAAGRNRAGAAARGVAFSGGAKRRDDIINAVDAAHAHAYTYLHIANQSLLGRCILGGTRCR